ncbi:MAG TPA: hypothetical protein VHU18_13260 [Rhizomicrobium sp.]|nr:hypothetical protein [Rhizomicrobium sp.]
MKKLLLPAAAGLAMLCAGNSAMAKSVSISFDGGCDGMDIIVETGANIALETGNGCDEGAHFGAGTIGKVKGTGKAITFGINLYGKGGGAYQYIFVISYPLVTGGTWSDFYTLDGKTFVRQYSGTYTVSGGAGHKATGLRSFTPGAR